MTGEPDLQRLRWSKIVTGWKRSERNARVVVIGDSNLNYLKWNDPGPRIARMVKQTKDELETLGFCQLIKKITRTWPGQPNSFSRPSVDKCTNQCHLNIQPREGTLRPQSHWGCIKNQKQRDSGS